MQKQGAEQRQRYQPTRLRAGPVKASQADRSQASCKRDAERMPAPLAKKQRDRHRQQQQDDPGQCIWVKHVPVEASAVHAFDQLERKLSNLGRRLRRELGDLLFDFEWDDFPFFPGLGGCFRRVDFSGFEFLNDVVSRQLESAEFFDAGIRKVQDQAKRCPPKRELGQAHSAQHKQSQIKRRQAGGKVDHCRQRHRLVFCLAIRQQLPSQPGSRQPGEPTG